MEGLLGEIIREVLAHEPDLEIVGEVADLPELLSRAELCRSDVVIACLAEGSDLPIAGRDLLDQHPHVKLLVVSKHGRQASLYRLRPERIAFEELSPSALIETIRGPARSTPPAETELTI
jgi:DNA-binding NarL/FixJ family response regulator